MSGGRADVRERGVSNTLQDTCKQLLSERERGYGVGRRKGEKEGTRKENE
jgi:hypothetical protein